MKISAVILSTLTILTATPALAAATCDAPVQQGNTWVLVCSEDGSGDSDSQCDYDVTITNKDGNTDTVRASGTVGVGQNGVQIWTGIEHDGSAIVSASANGGCTAK